MSYFTKKELFGVFSVIVILFILLTSVINSIRSSVLKERKERIEAATKLAEENDYKFLVMGSFVNVSLEGTKTFERIKVYSEKPAYEGEIWLVKVGEYGNIELDRPTQKYQPKESKLKIPDLNVEMEGKLKGGIKND